MTGRIRRTQAERRSESERALLDATIEVIAREGVGAVTFEALGKTGGFSRGLATSHFGSKANLIEAVLRNLHGRQEQLLQDHGLDARPGLDAVLAYADLCLSQMADSKEARAYFMLLSSSVAEANEWRPAFAETHAVVKDRLERWIVRGQADGQVRREVDSSGTAMMVGCLMFGISMQLLVDPEIEFTALRESSLAMIRASLSGEGMAADD